MDAIDVSDEAPTNAHRDRAMIQASGLFVAGVIVVALVVFILPAVLVSAREVPATPDRLDLQNKVRGTLLQGLGGAFLFMTAFFTYRQMANARAQLDLGRETLEDVRSHQHQQAERDERGQITERFSRAIEHLGHEDNLIARLGGIYALETIGRDNATMLHVAEEVLCAFIRRRAPWPPASGQPAVDTPPDAMPSLRERLPDVAAALIVLSRRRHGDDAIHDRPWPLDLSGVDLRGAELAAPPLVDPSGMLMKGPVRGSNFHNAFMVDSHFEGARLDGVDLTGADLRGADLRAASLGDARLDGAVLVGVRLEGTMLADAHVDPGAPSVARHDATTVWPADIAATLASAKPRGA